MSGPERTETFVLAFDGSGFEGRLAGALERAESGGAMKVVEALFVGRDPGSDEPLVLHVRGDAGKLARAITDFRLDGARRRAATEQALADGEQAPTVRRVVALLPPGGSAIVVTVRHAWLDVLTDAVTRTGGRVLVDETAEGLPGDSPAHRAFTALLADQVPDCSPEATPR